MSNIYIQEPPTRGKVCLETSVGDIEIELWSRECPKACRNFVQLCLENYYNKTKFHRVVKDFIVQGGDPTGTGEGGESIYGQPFKDEFHSRLRFVRRGLVAMANSDKDDNGSQFFFTMGPAQELQNKHTIFGKVVGDTLYNMLKLQEGVTMDDEERPLNPHKIIRAKVLDNPFDDLAPRETIRMAWDDEDRTKGKHKRPESKMKATKDFKLLSFGEEAEEEAEDLDAIQRNFRDKPKSSHDLLDDPKLLKHAGVNIGDEEPRANKVDLESLEAIRDKLKRPPGGAKGNPSKPKGPEEEIRQQQQQMDSDEDEEEAAKRQKRLDIKKEIMALKKEMRQGSSKPRAATPPIASGGSMRSQGGVEDADNDEASGNNDLLKAFHEERKKYSTRTVGAAKRGSSSREQQTMAMLEKFRQKLSKTEDEGSSRDAAADVEGDDDDDDDDLTSGGTGWMNNRLKFDNGDPVLAKDANTKDDDWFDIYDPRNPVNKRRRQNASEGAGFPARLGGKRAK